ncbi:MAG: hypothetical protein GC155_15085 [Alphaproteobacteria bacterium]|nr:hypothetical protein [Alphaproteobacteria bacterium]
MSIRTIPTTLAAAAFASVLSAPAMAQSPHSRPDQSWITISGRVQHPTNDKFLLNYGDGYITVEMDGWGDWGNAWKLQPGDQVTVTGKVDNDLFQRTSIEASSVFVRNLNTSFYANPADEESVTAWLAPSPYEYTTSLRGVVQNVRPAKNQFTLDIGRTSILVDVSHLNYNPLDKVGYQQITPGDRVLVSGDIDDGLFQRREIMASNLVTLDQRSSSGWRKSASIRADRERADLSSLSRAVRQRSAQDNYTTKDLVSAQLAALNDRPSTRR